MENEIKIEDHYGLVNMVINKHQNINHLTYYCGIQEEDAFQIGVIGLIKAINNYDSSRGSFSTYATHKINGEFRRYRRDYGSIISFGRTAKELFPKIHKEYKDKPFPTVEEIMEKYEVTEYIANSVIDYANFRQTMSSNSPLPSNDGEEIELQDSFYNDSDTFEEALKNIEFEEKMALLDDDERQIITLLLSGLPQETVKTIMGYGSQMTISRKKTKALKKMAQYDMEEMV